jgi:hypothetical protein
MDTTTKFQIVREDVGEDGDAHRCRVIHRLSRRTSRR